MAFTYLDDAVPVFREVDLSEACTIINFSRWRVIVQEQADNVRSPVHNFPWRPSGDYYSINIRLNTTESAQRIPDLCTVASESVQARAGQIVRSPVHKLLIRPYGDLYGNPRPACYDGERATRSGPLCF